MKNLGLSVAIICFCIIFDAYSSSLSMLKVGVVVNFVN